MKYLLPLLLSGLLLSGCDAGPRQTLEVATGSLFAASLSQDGRYALIGSVEHGASLWDIRRQERLFDWNHQPEAFTEVIAASFSPEGEYALTATPLDMVLWQVRTGEPVWFWSAPAEILDVALTPNGDLALLGLANQQAVLFDVKNGGIRQTLRHPARVRSVALSADARFAITGADDYQARFWDLRSGVELQRLPLGNQIERVALSGDGRTAFSSAVLDRAIIWDTGSGNLLHTLSGDEYWIKRRITHTSARFSDDGRRLVTGTAAGQVQLWDVEDGRLLQQWQSGKRKAYGPVSTSILATGFGDQGSLIAVGSNGLINLLQR